MIEKLRAILSGDPHIAYAILFGSSASGPMHPYSDVDVAIGVMDAARFDPIDLGELASRLEARAGRPVDLVLLDEAPPGLAYRVFRDGRTIVARDERALKTRRARAILEYLDFRPIEELCTRGVLDGAHGR